MASVASRASPPDRDMVWIEGGRFTMGSDDHYPEERPARAAAVGGFWIDRTPVTNREFARFVDATGYYTEAEMPADPARYPGAREEFLIPASLVFTSPKGPVDLKGSSEQWWAFVPGADWQHPAGPASDLEGLDDHPVVHVALADVEAYAAWAGAELPTEAEWEFAARGGSRKAFAWGNELMPRGRHMANVWQGHFPYRNTADDGWERTSPVGSFPPNVHGLFDMIGNVWEWTADWWALPGNETADHCCSGHKRAGSVAVGDTARIPRRVLKGGSHLCAPNYCRRYRPAARHAHPIDTSTSHIGFRCVVRM